MTVLGRDRIQEMCPRLGHGLVSPFDEGSVQPASYDLHLGPEHYVDDDGGVYGVLGDGETLRIPANGISFVITNETLSLPLDVAGQLSLTMGLIKQGVMLASQPPIDPGYSGKIIALLHNLSDKPVFIRRGDHMLTVTFFAVDPPASKGYSGAHQGLVSLAVELPSPPTGSLRQLRVDFDKLRTETQGRLQTILVALTVTITVLTVIVALLVGLWGAGLFGLIREPPQSPQTSGSKAASSSVDVIAVPQTEPTSASVQSSGAPGTP